MSTPTTPSPVIFKTLKDAVEASIRTVIGSFTAHDITNHIRALVNSKTWVIEDLPKGSIIINGQTYNLAPMVGHSDVRRYTFDYCQQNMFEYVLDSSRMYVIYTSPASKPAQPTTNTTTSAQTDVDLILTCCHDAFVRNRNRINDSLNLKSVTVTYKGEQFVSQSGRSVWRSKQSASRAFFAEYLSQAEREISKFRNISLSPSTRRMIQRALYRNGDLVVTVK